MFTTNIQRAIRYLLPAVIAFAMLASGALASHKFVVDGKWQHQHRATIPVYFEDSGITSVDMKSAVRVAMGSWDYNTVVNFDTVSRRSDARLRVVWDSYGTTGWYGRVTPCHHCTDQLLRINLSYGMDYTFAKEVACHELGHVIGLAHNQTDDCLGGIGRPGSAGPQSPGEHSIDLANRLHKANH